MENNNISNKLYIALSLLFCIIVSTLPYYGSMSTIGVAGMIICAIIACIVPIRMCLYYICFAYPFVAVLSSPIVGLGLTTLLEFVFIFRVLCFSKVKISPLSITGIVIFVSLSQLIPVILYEQNIIKIFVLCFNLLIFICVYKLYRLNYLNSSLLYLFFALGVIASCIVSFYIESDIDVDIDYIGRFTGLWTDPNFLGMFCLISIVTLINSYRNNFRRLLLSLPLIILLAYYGLLTQSRTFIIVSVFFILLLFIQSFKRINVKNILIITLFVVGCIYASTYVIDIIGSRGADRDWTNGRLVDTQIVFSAYGSDWISILFGVGFDNEAHFLDSRGLLSVTSHNTYVDILVEFGALFVSILPIVFIVKYKYIQKCVMKLFSMDGYVFLIILIYAGTLSLLKYEIFYIFSAIFSADIYNKKLIMSK